MTALSLDPVGMGLLRELVEAWEAIQVTRAFIETPHRCDINVPALEYWPRMDAYDTLCEQFCAHLLIMGSPDIDIQDLHHQWETNLIKAEDERDSGKLWNVTYEVCSEYIELYTAN